MRYIIAIICIVLITFISYFSTDAIIVERPLVGNYLLNNKVGFQSEIVILNDSMYIHVYEHNKIILKDTGVFKFSFENEYVQNLEFSNFNFIYEDDRIEPGRKSKIQFLYYVPSNRTAIISLYIESKSLDFIREIKGG